MKKYKFIKNLYQTISSFSAILLLVLILLGDFIASLNGTDNYGWVLPIIALALIIAFFLFGFYWIFQSVIIDESGIKILLFKKVLTEHHWDEVSRIEEVCVFRNPALAVIFTNGTKIHLDKRKKIIDALSLFTDLTQN